MEEDYFVSWLAFVLAVTGNILVVLKIRIAFVIWNLANIIWIYLAASRADWAQVALFTLYVLLNVWGFIRWCDDEVSQVWSCKCCTKGEDV